MNRFLAWRTLFHSNQRFVPLLGGIAFLGITLGVFFLMLVLSVMRGFQQELDRRWIGLNAHLTITNLPEEKHPAFESWKEVEEAQRFAVGEIILQAGEGEELISVAAKLRGLEILPKSFLNQVKIYPPLPNPLPLWGRGEGEGVPILGGAELFSSLGVHPDHTQSLKAIYPFGEIGPLGDFLPKTKKFKPTHVFQTGLYLWDAYTVVVPFDEARGLLGENAEKGWQVRLKNLSDLEKVEKRLLDTLPKGAKVETFAKQNAKLFAALKLERLGMTLLLILFLLIASFSMAGLLLMFLYSKQRDMAILRAIGFSPEAAKKLYLTIGGLLGFLGSLTGAGLGLIACLALHFYPIPLPSTYYLDFLPVRFGWDILAGSLLTGFVLTWASSQYPAHLVSKMEILPVLREE